MKTIVVGVDGSECSIDALRFALEEARLRAARVLAVHAWSPPHVSTYHEAAHLIEEGLPALERAAEQLLDTVVAQTLGSDRDVHVDKLVVEGPASAALVEAARDAILLVVGSRGLGGFKSLLLGSVGQQCTHHASCPVVIVRGPQSRPS
jgi:nucleotide-binding universal stress UspA family protein